MKKDIDLKMVAGSLHNDGQFNTSSKDSSNSRGTFLSAIAPREQLSPIKVYIGEISKELLGRMRFSQGFQGQGPPSNPEPEKPIDTSPVDNTICEQTDGDTDSDIPRYRGRSRGAGGMDAMLLNYFEGKAPASQKTPPTEGMLSNLQSPFEIREKKQGVENNHLSRIYLQRFLRGATKAGAPVKSIAQQVNSNPTHWQVEPHTKVDHARLQSYYNNHPGLEAEHQKLLKIEHSINGARLRLDQISAGGPNGDTENANGETHELSRQRLENRIANLEQASKDQYRRVEERIGDASSTQVYLNFYQDFQNRYNQQTNEVGEASIGNTPGSLNHRIDRQEVAPKDNNPQE